MSGFSTTQYTSTTEFLGTAFSGEGVRRLCPADRSDDGSMTPTRACGGRRWKSETEYWVGYYFVITVALGMLVGIHLLAIVFNRQRLEYWKKRDWSRHHMHGANSSATFWMGIALLVTYAANVYSMINTHLRMSVVVAHYCETAYSVLYFGVVLAKFGNYSFFLMRAQLTSALNEERTKYVVGFLFLYLSFACVMIGVLDIPGECSVNDDSCRRLCFWDRRDFNGLEQSMIALFVIVDMIATIFFTYIFGASYYRVVNSENVQGALHEGEQHTRKRDTAIRVNFLLSVMAMLSTTIFAVLFLNVKSIGNLFPTDFLLNSACLFFMLASNRRVSIYMFCCFKFSNQYQQMRQDLEKEIKKKETEYGGGSSSSDRPPAFGGRGRTVSQYAKQVGVTKQGWWYLKSRLFYTWLAYLLCPCGNRCYILVWPQEWTEQDWFCCDRYCKKRRKKRDPELRELFKQFDVEETGRQAKNRVDKVVHESVELGVMADENALGNDEDDKVIRSDTLGSIAGFRSKTLEHKISVESHTMDAD